MQVLIKLARAAVNAIYRLTELQVLIIIQGLLLFAFVAWFELGAQLGLGQVVDGELQRSAAYELLAGGGLILAATGLNLCALNGRTLFFYVIFFVYFYGNLLEYWQAGQGWEAYLYAQEGYLKASSVFFGLRLFLLPVISAALGGIDLGVKSPLEGLTGKAQSGRGLVKREVEKGGELVDMSTFAERMTDECRALDQSRRIRFSNSPAFPAMIGLNRLNRHAILVGQSGSGKTTVLTTWLDQLVEKCIKGNGLMILFDVKGDFTERYYGLEKVKLISPVDSRSEQLQPEIDDTTEAETVARILVPENPEAKDQYWDNAARSILKGLLIGLAKKNRLSWANLAAVLSRDDMVRKTLAGAGAKVALRHVDPSNPKRTSDILSNLSDHLEVIEPLAKAWKTRTMSVDDAVHRDSGVIILRYDPRYHELTSRTCGIFLESMILELFSLPDGNEKPYYLVVDEAQNLPKLSLPKCMSFGRSKNMTCIVGFQDLAMQKVYGEEGFGTIVGNAATHVCLNTSGPMSEWASMNIFSDQEVYTSMTSKSTSESMGQGPGGIPMPQQQESTSESAQYNMHRVVTAGELTSLPEPRTANGVVGYVKSVGLGTTVGRWEWPERKKTSQKDSPAGWTQKSFAEEAAEEAAAKAKAKAEAEAEAEKKEVA